MVTIQVTIGFLHGDRWFLVMGKNGNGTMGDES